MQTFLKRLEKSALYRKVFGKTSKLVDLEINNPTVLMIDAAYPQPDKDSGSLDQISFIHIFQSLGFDVLFFADTEFRKESAPGRLQLEALGVQCVGVPEFDRLGVFLQRHAAEIELFFLSRINFGGGHFDAIRKLSPKGKIIFNTVDLHYLRIERELSLTPSEDLMITAKDLKRRELDLIAKVDATIVVSDAEHTLLKRDVPRANVIKIPLIRDYSFRRHGDYEDRLGIGFIGGYAHLPNVDAMIYFLEEIWPIILQRQPHQRFYVIGSNMPDMLSQRSDAGVEFVGYVADLESWLHRLRLTVAPLRFGAGAKGKVVSSLAHGVPCIASSLAAEGMGLTADQNIIVADQPVAFADAVTSLYSDKTRWTKISDQGLDHIRSQSSLDQGIKLTRDLITSIS